MQSKLCLAWVYNKCYEMFYLEREITCGFLSGFSYLSWLSGGYFLFSVLRGWCEVCILMHTWSNQSWKACDAWEGLIAQMLRFLSPLSCVGKGRHSMSRVNQKAGWGEPLIIMFFSEDIVHLCGQIFAVGQFGTVSYFCCLESHILR